MKSSNKEQLGQHVARRTVLKAATWSVPVIAASVAVPLNAASLGTGFLYLIGSAIREESFGLALSYDATDATRQYAPGELGVIITLPNTPGTVDNFNPTTNTIFTATRSGQVITMLNKVTIPSTGGLYGGNISVTGPFPLGARYTIVLVPSSVNWAPIGNLSLDGEFLPPRGG